MKRIKVNIEKCTGCRYCELLCSYYHEGRFSPQLSRVRVLKNDIYGLDYPVMCHQCDHCPALETCPINALTRTDLGVVEVDRNSCTSCGSCVDACKYGSVRITKAPLICDLCEGEPVCVTRCPTHALSFESVEEPQQPEVIFREILRRWGIDG